MRAEKNVNLDTHFDLQPNFQNLKKKILNKQHRKYFSCVSDASYGPVRKGWAGGLWERGDKYFLVVYEVFFSCTSVSSKVPISFHISS